MRFMYREKSRISPVPMELPAMEVPPPRQVMPTPCSMAMPTAMAASSAPRGSNTAVGMTR